MVRIIRTHSRLVAADFRLEEFGERIGVVKQSAVRTGRLRRSPVVHSRPIDLVVFQEPSSINRLETSS